MKKTRKEGVKPEKTEKQELPKIEGEKEKNNRVLIGASLGIMILFVITVISLNIFTSLNQEKESLTVEVPVSVEELLLNSDLEDFENSLNSLDENNDFIDFSDEEVAAGDVEESYDEALEEMETIMKEIDTIENELEDFSEEDF